MKDIEFFVEGIPKAQARPCAFYNKKTGRAGVYDKGNSAEWKYKIIEACKKNNFDSFKDSPIHLGICFYMPRPKDHFISGNIDKGKKASSPTRHTKKPDLDNLEKAVMDALTDYGMWNDDSFVCSKNSIKIYGDDEFGVNILIETLGKHDNI